MTLEIKCINKENRNNSYERIINIGGLNNDGTKWKITQKQAINYIDNGEHNFYVNMGGDRANVIVSTSKFGNKYIKTENDGDEPNNLLSLPECS